MITPEYILASPCHVYFAIRSDRITEVIEDSSDGWNDVGALEPGSVEIKTTPHEITLQDGTKAQKSVLIDFKLRGLETDGDKVDLHKSAVGKIVDILLVPLADTRVLKIKGTNWTANRSGKMQEGQAIGYDVTGSRIAQTEDLLIEETIINWSL